MSAFIMTDEAFRALADELASHAENPTRTLDTHYMFAEHIRDYLGLNTYGVDAYPKASTKAQEFYTANVSAVNQRYGDQSVPATLRLRRRSFLPQWTPVQFIKHLQCLSYQMSEGDVSKSPIRQELNNLISQLCEAVVNGLPEWNSAAWDVAA